MAPEAYCIQDKLSPKTCTLFFHRNFNDIKLSQMFEPSSLSTTSITSLNNIFQYLILHYYFKFGPFKVAMKLFQETNKTK